MKDTSKMTNFTDKENSKPLKYLMMANSMTESTKGKASISRL